MQKKSSPIRQASKYYESIYIPQQPTEQSPLNNDDGDVNSNLSFQYLFQPQSYINYFTTKFL